MINLIRGLYTSTTGMLVQMARQDVISNNLSNANTVGYKKDFSTFVSFPDRLLYAESSMFRTPVGGLGLGASVNQVSTNLESGSLRQTDSKLDFAIDGEGFFALQSPQGVRYTKDGQFMLDAQGQIVNKDGFPVLGTNGFPLIPGTSDFYVDTDGQVFANGTLVGQFQLFFPTQPAALQKLGDGTFIGGGAQGAGQARVLQSHLEGSNVDVTKEIIEMIAGVRAYASNQRAIQVHDDLLGKAVNEVGRV